MTTDLNIVVEDAVVEIETVEVEVVCLCGHKERIVVENTFEAVSWIAEDALSNLCSKCEDSWERQQREQYEDEVYS